MSRASHRRSTRRTHMRFIRHAHARCSACALAIALAAAPASAQTTSGTITGRVIDNQNLAVPGVTVTVESPNLQGALSAVTSENGDYILPQLPPGTYTVTFTLERLRPPAADDRRRADADGAAERHARPGRARRDGERRRQVRRRADADGAGRDQLQAGPDRDAADQSRHQLHAADGAGGPSVRARPATTRSPARCRSSRCTW